mgnify:FL=1|tara:strand:- start:3730 stop:3957 length:228 start_codon:yes stop_codon:yes gene_type:complete
MKKQTKKQQRIKLVEQAFHRFAAGDLRKWEAYGVGFEMVDARQIKLSEVVETAKRIADISKPVVEMRRSHWLAMK